MLSRLSLGGVLGSPAGLWLVLWWSPCVLLVCFVMASQYIIYPNILLVVFSRCPRCGGRPGCRLLVVLVVLVVVVVMVVVVLFHCLGI